MSEEPQRKYFKSEYYTPFVNYDNNASWILRVTLAKDGKLQMKDPGKNSIFVWYELPEAILEYADNKIIVSLYPSSFLFIEDWMPIRHLKQDLQNIQQYCIKPHPKFHLEKFPFIIVAGKNYFSWINVKDNLINEFI